MMRFPALRGVIDRRILVNYRVDPDVLAAILPAPFRPKLVEGSGIAGICLIRLAHLRPRGLPAILGLTSENAAHRIAVEWEEQGQRREGVYIPRRDSASRLNTWLGGRIVPGFHQHARFRVAEQADHLYVALDSDDRQTHVVVEGDVAEALPPTSVFKSVAEASAFFEGGSVDYSPARSGDSVQGIRLQAFTWQVVPLAIRQVESSFFEDPQQFPPGTCTFDCALLMRGIEHAWYPAEAPGVAPAVQRPAQPHDAHAALVTHYLIVPNTSLVGCQQPCLLLEY